MKKSILAAVAAVSTDGVVGRNGDLPWHVPEDLKFFKDKTRGSPIIMGRKTFDAIQKPLPNRLNIVLTRQPDFAPPGVIVARTLDEALAAAEKVPHPNGEIYIVGGGEIWKMAMDRLDRLYITVIDVRVPDGDSWFPGWPDRLPSDFKQTECREGREKNPTYRFLTFDRQRG